MVSRLTFRSFLTIMLGVIAITTGFVRAPVPVLAETPAVVGHEQVIAHGIDQMPTVPVSWRYVTATASPVEAASFHNRTLGFLLGTNQPVLLSDGRGGFDQLTERTAAFTAQGTSIRVSSLETGPASYGAIELIVTDAVDTNTPDRAAIAYVGDSFTAPSGHRDLRLTREVHLSGESGGFAGTGNTPWLLIVTEGSIEVRTGNTRVDTLTAGDALQMTGQVQLTGGQGEGGTWVAASIGDDVSLPAAPADDYQLTVEYFVCPANLKPETDGTEDCKPASEPWDFEVFVYRNDETMLNVYDDAVPVFGTSNQFVFSDLTQNQQMVSWGDETIWIDGVEWGAGGAYVDWNESNSAVVRLYRSEFISQEPIPGSVILTLYRCPAGGGDPQNPCQLATEPWDISFSDKDSGMSWGMSSATMTSTGVYRFDGLPATQLIAHIDPDGPQSGYEVTVDGDLYSIPDVWVIDIPVNGVAVASVYLSSPTASIAEGQLTIEQLDCPYGTNINVDTMPCEQSIQPWDVIVVNTATGDSWSLLNDGTYADIGTYTLTNLPSGNYQIQVYANGNWMVYTSPDVWVIEGQQTWETVFSVDLREP